RILPSKARRPKIQCGPATAGIDRRPRFNQGASSAPNVGFGSRAGATAVGSKESAGSFWATKLWPQVWYLTRRPAHSAGNLSRLEHAGQLLRIMADEAPTTSQVYSADWSVAGLWQDLL